MTAPSLTTADSGLGQDTVKTAYNRAAFFAFRAANVFRQIAEIKWFEGDDPMPGNPVTFTKVGALAVATTPLSETVEPTPVALTDSTASITLAEYGNVVKRSRKVALTSFYKLDLAVPREVAANMEETVDILARNILVAATNVTYGNAATEVAGLTNIAATNNMTANTVRRAVARLQSRKVRPPTGQFYPTFMHPDVAYDLMAESGQQAWSAPHVYSDPAGIYNGEVGMLAGARVIVNANANLRTDIGNGAGAGGTIDGYDTLFIGQQALGEAVGDPQHMVVTDKVDDLQRFVAIGWYALMGWGIIRQESIQRVVNASSIGLNT